MRYCGVALAYIGLLRSEHHLQLLVIGKLLHGFARDIGGLLPQLRIAIAFDDLLISARRIVVPEVEHLTESVDGSVCLMLLAVDGSQTLEEHRAIVLVTGGVFEVRLLGLLQQPLQDLRRFVVTSLRFINQRGVVGDFKRVGDE